MILKVGMILAISNFLTIVNEGNTIVVGLVSHHIEFSRLYCQGSIIVHLMAKKVYCIKYNFITTSRIFSMYHQ